MELPTHPNQKLKHLFNPLAEDFTVEHLNDENQPESYTIHGLEIGTFPTYLADYIEIHLVDHIGNYRGWEKNTELQKQHIREEIEAEIEDE